MQLLSRTRLDGTTPLRYELMKRFPGHEGTGHEQRSLTKPFTSLTYSTLFVCPVTEIHTRAQARLVSRVSTCTPHSACPPLTTTLARKNLQLNSRREEPFKAKEATAAGDRQITPSLARRLGLRGKVVGTRYFAMPTYARKIGFGFAATP